MFCNTSIEQAQEWNTSNPHGFSEELFIDLCKRMEQPNPKSKYFYRFQLTDLLIDRWDSPLFFVNEDQDTPFEDISQTLLFDKKVAKDPVSTKQDIVKTGNYLHDLDKNLQSILDQIIAQQNNYTDMNPGVDRILMQMKFTNSKKEITLKRVIPIGDVKQFKTEFIEMQKMNPMSNLDNAVEAFIDFIQYYEDDF